MIDIWSWMDALVRTYGYAGAFFVSILGNLTILIPVPYAIVIYACGGTLEPLLLGLVGGLGSTIGEFSSYFLGRGGRKLIEGKYGARLDNVMLLVQRFGIPVVFLFALLPLPDDLVMIPLGMIKYSVKKAFAAMFLGKFSMSLVLAYAGRFSYSYIRDLFESGSVLTGVISVALLIVLIVAIIKVDWTRFIKIPEPVSSRAEAEKD